MKNALKIMWNLKNILIITLVVLAVVARLYLIHAQNMIGVYTLEAAALRHDVADVQTKNDNLRIKIYNESSYRQLASRAAALGFEKKEMLYLR